MAQRKNEQLTPLELEIMHVLWETGIANVIFKPDIFQRLRVTILSNPYLLIDGILQNQRGVASVKATDARPCPVATTAVPTSHDFH